MIIQLKNHDRRECGLGVLVLVGVCVFSVVVCVGSPRVSQLIIVCVTVCMCITRKLFVILNHCISVCIVIFCSSSV